MKKLIAVCVTSIILAVGSAAQADIMTRAYDNFSPSKKLGPYEMKSFSRDPRPKYSLVNSVDTPLGGSVDFDIPMSLRYVNSGWGDWSHGYYGDVYWTIDSKLVTLTLPPNTQAFYFYASPDYWEGCYLQATAQDGTYLRQLIDRGYGGAKGYGFYGTDGSLISTIELQVFGQLESFAIGEFGISIVPVPGAVLLGSIGLGFAGWICKRKKL
jgi:hypothetical protein